MDSVPIVDFSVYKLGAEDVHDEELQKLCEEVRRAFTEVGFVYLKNTGIDQDEVDRVMAVSKKFFLLPEEKKAPFSRGNYSESPNHGWVSLERERLNPRRPGDLKEAFNATCLRPDIDWPSVGADDFCTTQLSFCQRCADLSLRVLRVMALSLGIDANLFLKAHSLIGGEGNCSSLRSLYYPAVKSESVKEGQVRCGEHSDYGSITLVFQNDQGGLEDWPSVGADDFCTTQLSFCQRCADLSLRVLRVMALSLGIDANLFLKAHSLIGGEGNCSSLRSLYYPAVKSESVKEGQVRCGEHSDYGSITLVFQNDQGGLEVRNRKGKFISVPSIPGTVVVNIADLMQRWTSDVFVSSVHRVLLPPSGDSSTRQSLAFFVQPDDEAIITCCDGSNKYPPVKSMDYLMSRFSDTYGEN